MFCFHYYLLNLGTESQSVLVLGKSLWSSTSTQPMRHTGQELFTRSGASTETCRQHLLFGASKMSNFRLRFQSQGRITENLRLISAERRCGEGLGSAIRKPREGCRDAALGSRRREAVEPRGRPPHRHPRRHLRWLIASGQLPGSPQFRMAVRPPSVTAH